MGFPPGRPRALILGCIVRIVYRVGWPLHCWPCIVDRLMCTGLEHGLLMVLLGAWRLPWPIALHIAIAVALLRTQSARNAVVLRFRRILEVLIMPLTLWVCRTPWMVHVALIWPCRGKSRTLARLGSSWPRCMNRHVAASGRIASVLVRLLSWRRFFQNITLLTFCLIVETNWSLK